MSGNMVKSLLRSPSISEPVSNANRLLSEDGHPRDYPIVYITNSTTSYENDNNIVSMNLTDVASVKVWSANLQAAAVANGAFQVYDQTAGAAFTPNITITQGAGVVLVSGTELTPDASSSGASEVRFQNVSGENAKNCRTYAGVVREVLA